jgi:hypothetical protein
MWRAFGWPWGLTGNQSTTLVHLHLQWRRRAQELLCVKCQTVEGEKKGGSWDLISLCMYRADGTGRVLGRGNLYYGLAFEIRDLRQPHQETQYIEVHVVYPIWYSYLKAVFEHLWNRIARLVPTLLHNSQDLNNVLNSSVLIPPLVNELSLENKISCSCQDHICTIAGGLHSFPHQCYIQSIW